MKTINVENDVWKAMTDVKYKMGFGSMGDTINYLLFKAGLATSTPLAPSLETPKPKPKPKPKDSKTDEQRIAEGAARLEALKARLSGGEPAETLLIGEGEQVKPEARGEKIKIAYTDD